MSVAARVSRPSPLQRLHKRFVGEWLSSIPEQVLVFQVLCQVLLIVDGLGRLRTIFRALTFGSSVFMFAWLLSTRRPGPMHPAARASSLVVIVLIFALIHPDSNTVTASLAQIAMYLSILSPLVWVACCRVDNGVLRRLILILLAFHTLSSLFGVLQTYYPETFQPKTAFGTGASAQMQLADGRVIYRIMGLTDTPGGAATSGFYAVLLGVAMLLQEKERWTRLLSVTGITLGMFCLYLAQSRSRFVMTAVCVLVLMGLVAYRRQIKRLAVVGTVGVFAVTAAFSWATRVGGAQSTDRLATLVTTDPSTLYYSSRGTFLEKALFEDLPQYPLGAGLGRWGMMSTYFGQRDKQLFVEIQITGWIFDGGLLMVMAYLFTLSTAFWVAWRLATRTSTQNPLWIYAALVFAYNVGAFAMSFSLPVFMSQFGMELWLLNGTLFGAYVTLRRRDRERSRALEVRAEVISLEPLAPPRPTAGGST